MARPSKATVEYFPLVCQFGDSIQAVENLYGNDGFVVWVKLLQKLGRSDNHYIDVRTNTAWKLFYSIFKIEEHVVLNILDTLAELECIDPELWEHKIIYSQNFVDGISDAYRKRKMEPITYKAIFELARVSGGRNPQYDVVSSGRNPVSGAGNPQSKLKETKVKESKVKVVVDIQSENKNRSAKAPAAHQRTEIVSGNDLSERIEIVSNNQATTTTTIPQIPTLDEVRVYSAERGNKANPDKFHAHYEGKGWKIKEEPIKDWKAAFRYWEQNEKATANLHVVNPSVSHHQRKDCQPYKPEKVEITPEDEIASREIIAQLGETLKERKGE